MRVNSLWHRCWSHMSQAPQRVTGAAHLEKFLLLHILHLAVPSRQPLGLFLLHPAACWTLTNCW